MNLLIGFGRFWYDFIVGDSWILAVGGVVILVLGFILAQTAGGALPQLALPAAAILTVTASVSHAR